MRSACLATRKASSLPLVLSATQVRQLLLETRPLSAVSMLSKQAVKTNCQNKLQLGLKSWQVGGGCRLEVPCAVSRFLSHTARPSASRQSVFWALVTWLHWQSVKCLKFSGVKRKRGSPNKDVCLSLARGASALVALPRDHPPHVLCEWSECQRH